MTGNHWLVTVRECQPTITVNPSLSWGVVLIVWIISIFGTITNELGWHLVWTMKMACPSATCWLSMNKVSKSLPPRWWTQSNQGLVHQTDIQVIHLISTYMLSMSVSVSTFVGVESLSFSGSELGVNGPFVGGPFWAEPIKASWNLALSFDLPVQILV